MSPEGKFDQTTEILHTDDLSEAERKKELVETVTGSNTDSLDELRAVKQRLDDTRKAADKAAGDARAKQAYVEGELATLQKAEQQQAQVKAAVSQRISAYQAEATQLQGEDANMQRIISEAQARLRGAAAGRRATGRGPGRRRPSGPGRCPRPVVGLERAWPVAGSAPRSSSPGPVPPSPAPTGAA